jgi:Spy/CpxP family protein refolding chaperone
MKTAKFCSFAACLLFAFAVFLTTATPAHAQTAAASQSGKMDPDTPENDTALNLTDDQKTQIAAIRSDAADQRKTINKDKTLSDTDKETQLKTLKKSTRAKVWAILTPDQQKQWALEARAHRQEKKAASSPQ